MLFVTVTEHGHFAVIITGIVYSTMFLAQSALKQKLKKIKIMLEIHLIFNSSAKTQVNYQESSVYNRQYYISSRVFTLVCFLEIKSRAKASKSGSIHSHSFSNIVF